MQELAWRTRIEGSERRAEREFNGPVVGLQQLYREGIAALGADFADLDGTTSKTAPRRRCRSSNGSCTNARAKACTAIRCTAATETKSAGR